MYSILYSNSIKYICPLQKNIIGPGSARTAWSGRPFLSRTNLQEVVSFQEHCPGGFSVSNPIWARKLHSDIKKCITNRRILSRAKRVKPWEVTATRSVTVSAKAQHLKVRGSPPRIILTSKCPREVQSPEGLVQFLQTELGKPLLRPC